MAAIFCTQSALRYAQLINYVGWLLWDFNYDVGSSLLTHTSNAEIKYGAQWEANNEDYEGLRTKKNILTKKSEMPRLRICRSQ